MATMNRILTLTVAVLSLAPSAALADGPIRYDVNGRYDSGGGIELGLHIHSSSCRHSPQPVSRPQEQGRYELRTVQRYVPGYEEKVWVPEQCTTETETKHKKNKGHKKHGKYKQVTRTTTVCEPGHYDFRRVAGHYVNEEQWVWVSTTPPGHSHRHVVARR